MYHTRKMAILALIAMLTQEICYAPIGAVNSGGSGSKQSKHGKTSLGSEESDVDWNERLLKSLVYIWLASDPATEGHADRMFRMWSSNPSEYPPMSKEKLYQTAQQFTEEGKVPFSIGRREEQKETFSALTGMEECIRWAQFKIDANKFLAQLPDGRLKLEKPLCDVFLDKYHKYVHLDRQAMRRYLYSKRSHTGQTSVRHQGSHSRTPHGQESQKSIPQNFGASSSQIPQTDTHFQGYSDPRQSQPSYINFSHGGMFGSTPQFSQYHQIHHLPDQLHQGGSHYYHGESSSQTPRFRVERPAPPRLNHTSDEHERGRRSRTRSQSESLSSRGDGNDLDLDLHL